MPLYRYKCKKCNWEGVASRTIANRDDAPPCPECGVVAKRMLDVASVSFVGKGFASNE